MDDRKMAIEFEDIPLEEGHAKWGVVPGWILFV